MGGGVSQMTTNMGNSQQFGSPQPGGGGGKGGASLGQKPMQQPMQQPTSVEGLYQTVLGRQSDQGGADYWKQQFGDTVDANEYQTFLNAAQPEMQQRGLQAPTFGSQAAPPPGQQPSAGGKGASSVNSYPGPQATFPGQGGQPRMGMKNQYSNTVGGWDNTQIRPVGQQGKGKGG